jgi:hypothetical protein
MSETGNMYENVEAIDAFDSSIELFRPPIMQDSEQKEWLRGGIFNLIQQWP